MRKKWHCAILLVLLTIAWVNSRALADDNKSAGMTEKLRAVVSSNREVIKSLLGKVSACHFEEMNSIIEGIAKDDVYLVFLDQLVTAGITAEKTSPLVYQILEKSGSDSRDVGDVIQISEMARRRQYVQDSCIIEYVALSLNSDDRSLRSSADAHLQSSVHSKYLNQSHIELLISAWDRRPDIHSEELLSLVAGTKDPRATAFIENLIKKGEDVPEKIRAKLGDREIETKLINGFLKEEDAKKKGELALQLGYIGSDDCIKALVSQMRTPLIVETDKYAYSVRYQILKGLQWSFPEEELFSEVLPWITMFASLSDRANIEKRYDTYFDLVEKWCQQHYKIKWDCERPPFLLYHRRIVITPGNL